MCLSWAPWRCSSIVSRSSASPSSAHDPVRSPHRAGSSSQSRRPRVSGIGYRASAAAFVMRRIFSVPRSCPAMRGRPCFAAHRPLPSMMIATWTGKRRRSGVRHGQLPDGSPLGESPQMPSNYTSRTSCSLALPILSASSTNFLVSSSSWCSARRSSSSPDQLFVQQLADAVHRIAANVPDGDFAHPRQWNEQP